MHDPNLTNPAFVHGVLSLLMFDLAACIISGWLIARGNR